jgi:hypothetical protein
MRPAELGELIRNPKFGKLVHKMISMVPRLQLAASIQPLTRTLLRIDLVVTPDFKWDVEQHGFVEPFIIMVRATAANAAEQITGWAGPFVGDERQQVRYWCPEMCGHGAHCHAT